MSALADLGAFGRYAFGLPRWLRAELGPEQAREHLRRRLEARAPSFLGLIERAVYGQDTSVYRRLLEHAGLERGDVAALVREHGIEGALERLHAAGVYVTVDEFKGRRPIERGNLVLPTRAADFDNPLSKLVYASRTGGSRGTPRRVGFDFGHMTSQAIYRSLFVQAFGLAARPGGIWRAAPPGSAALGAILGAAKIGTPVERWFSPSRVSDHARELLLTAYSVAGGRFAGTRVPWPEYVPVDSAATVARWLAEKKRAGTPAFMSTTSSSGVRACLAAREGGLDISGTFFRFGGEPYTRGRADVITEAGCKAVSNYSMTEIGRVGTACASPAALDDLHLTIDQLGVIQRERTFDGAAVSVLTFSTLRPTAPKLMLNVESDDYGVLERRSCGCPLGELGLDLHVQGVRSHEKLTSEGMTFLGSDLIQLVDEILPARFGGHPTDYQLVEEEVSGLPEVRIVVSPRVGVLDEDAVVAAVISKLAEGPRYRKMMAGVWEAGEMLRVVRREPYTTGAAKILPLHVL
jgi:hypothetical protein